MLPSFGPFSVRFVGTVAFAVDENLFSLSCFLFLVVWFAVRSYFSTGYIRGLGVARFGVVSGYRLVLRPKLTRFDVFCRSVFVWGREPCWVSYCQSPVAYLQ